MAAILTTTKRVSDFLKKEFWVEERFCRKSATVTIPSGGLDVGQVLTLSGGKWIVPTSGFAAGDDVAILVDETVVELAAGDHTLGILVKGPAIVYAPALDYGAATESLVNTELEALNIRVQS